MGPKVFLGTATIEPEDLFVNPLCGYTDCFVLLPFNITLFRAAFCVGLEEIFSLGSYKMLICSYNFTFHWAAEPSVAPWWWWDPSPIQRGVASSGSGQMSLVSSQVPAPWSPFYPLPIPSPLEELLDDLQLLAPIAEFNHGLCEQLHPLSVSISGHTVCTRHRNKHQVPHCQDWSTREELIQLTENQIIWSNKPCPML